MDKFRVIFEDYPPDVEGYVVESIGDDGEPFYTIFLNAQLNDERQRETFYHEMLHISKDDFHCVEPVDEMEKKRHDEAGKLKYEFAI